MTIKSLITIADAYASLGDAITSQLRDAIDKGEPVTPGAASYINDRLMPLLNQLSRDLKDEDFDDEVGDLQDLIDG